MSDEWFERWADAQINEIEKVDRDTKERYAQLSASLHTIELELISVTAAVQELRASLDDLSDDFATTTGQFSDMIRQNSDSILKHTTTCPHPKVWQNVWDRLYALEAKEHERKGSGRWETLIINACVSVITALVVIAVAYIVSNGKIA
jgi:uncharacterized protein YoxC